MAPAYTVVSARHHMLWPATVRRIDVPACVWVCCASLGGVLGPSRTAGTGGPHHPGTWLLSRPNFASSFASFWSNTTCWGLLKQPYKQKEPIIMNGGIKRLLLAEDLRRSGEFGSPAISVQRYRHEVPE